MICLSPMTFETSHVERCEGAVDEDVAAAQSDEEDEEPSVVREVQRDGLQCLGLLLWQHTARGHTVRTITASHAKAHHSSSLNTPRNLTLWYCADLSGQGKLRNIA